MFEQEVPAEGKLELNVFACRGDIEVLGHDAPTLRVEAQDPQTEYHVREEDQRFIVEASGPLRIDVPRAAQLTVVAGPRKVSVHNMEGEFTVEVDSMALSPADSCTASLGAVAAGASVSHSGAWDRGDGCRSVNATADRESRYYADYVSFTVSEAVEVSVRLSSVGVSGLVQSAYCLGLAGSR